MQSKTTLIRSTQTLSKSLYQKNASPTLNSPPQRFSHILIPLLLLASTMQKLSSQSNTPKDFKLQRSSNRSHLLYLTNPQLWQMDYEQRPIVKWNAIYKRISMMENQIDTKIDVYLWLMDHQKLYKIEQIC